MIQCNDINVGPEKEGLRKYFYPKIPACMGLISNSSIQLSWHPCAVVTLGEEFANVNELEIWKLSFSRMATMEFFLNVFVEFSKIIQWQKYCHHSKRVPTCHLLCKRSRCYHSTSKTHVRDRNFKLSLIHALVIIEIPWIRWIQWKFCSI